MCVFFFTLLVLWQCLCFFYAKGVNSGEGTGVAKTALTAFITTQCLLNMREEQQATKATSKTHCTILLLYIDSVSLQPVKNETQPCDAFACFCILEWMFLLYLVELFWGILMHAKTQLSQSAHCDVKKGMCTTMIPLQDY